MKHFKVYSTQDIDAVTRPRKFETRLGEVVQVVDNAQTFEESLQNSTAHYVVFGIPEDAGVIANEGRGGTHTAWKSFLESFVNIQSNDFLKGENILLAGHFDFGKEQSLINVNAASEPERILAYRSLVSKIDEEVEELVKIIVRNGRIPIIIGGGHNNAYPAIKGSAKGLNSIEKIPLAQIHAINLDAHPDYRPLEGRHSGNAFRYADEDGYLNKYVVLGIHENYLQQNVWIDIVNNPFMDCITYEDIFIHGKRDFIQSVAHAIDFTNDGYTGIELDLDSIEGVLSSAVTPCGITALQARQYLNITALACKVAYLHISEGITRLASGESNPNIGKLITYLVSDFIKSHLRKLEVPAE